MPWRSWLRALVPRRPRPRPPHTHLFRHSGTHDWAPTSDTDLQPHTSFWVLQCPCGAVTVFPQSNYERTVQPFRAQFEEDLWTRGLHWA